MHAPKASEEISSSLMMRIGGLVLILAVAFGAILRAADQPAESAKPRRDRAAPTRDGGFRPVEAREAVPRTRHRAVDAQIIGGTQVSQGTHNFAAFIAADVGGGFAQVCTGSLINPLFVVTAAHCVEDETGTLFDPAQYTLIIGRASRLSPPEANVFAVARVFQHPEWDPDAFRNDVAVLKLSRAVPANVAQPISLVAVNDNRFDSPGQGAIAAGWGRTDGNRPEGSPNLLEIDTTVISDAACDAFFAGDVDGASVVCAQVPARSTCQGDSGGPLFVTPPSGTAKHQAKGKAQENGFKAERKKKKRPKPTPSPVPPQSRTLIGVTSFGALTCPPGGANGFAQLSAPVIHDFVASALNS